MKATYQIKHCGGKREANHADRTFDVSSSRMCRKKSQNQRTGSTTAEQNERKNVGRMNAKKYTSCCWYIQRDAKR